jgi:Flp pilus assembly protein TadD
MAKPSRFASAASIAVLATLLGGCATSGDRVANASSLGGSADGEVGLAMRALAALSANNVPVAIDFAERAVARTPTEASVRTLLGNAYFAGGRFASAEAAYKDSLVINARQPQVVLKLALVEIAQGKDEEAVALLEANRTLLDIGNYGLALALAGRIDNAISALDLAARAQGADGRIRQNLALAYALAGDWTKARTIAAQDLPGNQLDQRIQQWMQLAKPAHAFDQVAALTGVTPAAADPGQPVQLALGKTDTQVAQAEPATGPDAQPAIAEAAPQNAAPAEQGAAPAPQFADAAPVTAPQPETAAPAPPPADPQRVAAATEAPTPANAAIAASMAPEAPAAFAAVAAGLVAPAPKAKPRRAAAPVRHAALRRGNSGPVMQLGAYSSAKNVAAAWDQLTNRYPALRGYLPMRARFDSPKGTFWRLSITGFESQREAIARCDLLKGRGGKCFVRGFAGDAPVQIASR